MVLRGRITGEAFVLIHPELTATPPQCAMPVFESLFPPGHDESIQTLLFRLTEWHALAKLRLHTEETLMLLHQALRQMSDQLRKFKENTCSKFDTSELPQEAT
jgi:hypothetical protein